MQWDSEQQQECTVGASTSAAEARCSSAQLPRWAQPPFPSCSLWAETAGQTSGKSLLFPSSLIWGTIPCPQSNPSFFGGSVSVMDFSTLFPHADVQPLLSTHNPVTTGDFCLSSHTERNTGPFEQPCESLCLQWVKPENVAARVSDENINKTWWISSGMVRTVHVRLRCRLQLSAESCD